MWRKAWDSIIGPLRERRADTEDGLGLGPEMELLPSELLLEIVRRAGPMGAAAMHSLNRSWRRLVSSDNSLWIHFLRADSSLFFAESHLRSGPPLRPSSTDDDASLSFMRVYSQRAQVPGSVILDGGSGYCKFGWSKYAAPSGRSATFLEFGNIETPMYSRLRHFFSTVYSRMQVKASAHPLVLSLPLCHYGDTDSAKASRRQLKETIYSALFDMNVPAVCAVNQAALALYAARRTSGIVINIGFQVTSIVPILHGKVMHKVGIEVTGVGALKVTGFLREQMQQNNVNFESLYTVRTLKEVSGFYSTLRRLGLHILKLVSFLFVY